MMPHISGFAIPGKQQKRIDNWDSHMMQSALKNIFNDKNLKQWNAILCAAFAETWNLIR